MRLLTSFTVVIGAGLVATACADPTAVRSPLSTPSASFTKSGYRPLTYPNSRKYRDAGFHPATASAGSATISTRSLLGKSGRTDVEVTTGTFDGGATTGTLSFVQVKGYDPKGVQLFTSTNNGLSGTTASFPYTNLTRGSGVQVKANVRNGVKTDVVTVNDVVHLRPDPAALRIDGPASALLGSPVVLTPFIMERNGDVGARFNCVLYIDGAEADRADGLWVDAGGIVTCAMAHAFTAAGTHALEVRVENVRPGDYDVSNNSATASIQIVQLSEYHSLQLGAQSVVENSSNRYIYKLTTIDGIEETWDQTTSEQGPHQFASMIGLLDHTLTFPVAMHGEMATNGTTINTLDATLPTSASANWWPPEWQVSCATSFTASNNLYICTYGAGYLAGHSTIQYDWWGADVQYHSASYVTYFDPSCTNSLCERYVVNDYSQVGPMFTFGPDFSGRLSVQGASDDMATTGVATVPLFPFSTDYDFVDPSCSTTPAPTSCTENHVHTVGVFGYIELGSWPPYVP